MDRDAVSLRVVNSKAAEQNCVSMLCEHVDGAYMDMNDDDGKVRNTS